jgi:hypothetical protein
MKNKMKFGFAIIAIAFGFATCKFASSETSGKGKDSTAVDSAQVITDPGDTTTTQPQDSTGI